jgi:predicted Na+-dependent transporter
VAKQEKTYSTVALAMIVSTVAKAKTTLSPAMTAVAKGPIAFSVKSAKTHFLVTMETTT